MIRVEQDNETGDDVSNNHRLHSVLAAVITTRPEEDLDEAKEINSPGTALIDSHHASGDNFVLPNTSYQDANLQLPQNHYSSYDGAQWPPHDQHNQSPMPNYEDTAGILNGNYLVGKKLGDAKKSAHHVNERRSVGRPIQLDNVLNRQQKS